MRAQAAALLGLGLTLTGCDGNDPPTGDNPPDETPTGTLVVTTSTGGDDPDRDGYLVTVDGIATLALSPTGIREFDLSPGRHTVRLAGVATHCSVAPGVALDIDVSSGATTTAAFEIDCPLTGARLTTTTTGEDLDPDGYRAVVEGAVQGAVPPNGTTLLRLGPGTRTITLSDLAPNCALDGLASQVVTIVAAEVASVEFAVECTAIPAASMLAFDRVGDIYVGRMDGSNVTRLTFDGSPYSPHSYNREAAWSPDGSRIAFTKLDGEWTSGIYVIDANGANLTRLSPTGAYDASPAWSPDGSRIVFENSVDNRSIDHIFVMNADGTNRVQLTSNRQPNAFPAWSPDGQRIAYTTSEDNPGDDHGDIYLMDPDGTNRERLTSEVGTQRFAEWSPDGNRIAFIGQGGLFAINRDGTNLVHLTPGTPEPGAGWMNYASWSRDGSLIAVTRATNCHTDSYGDPSCDVGIWVVPLDGSPMSLLPLGYAFHPSWRP